MCPHAEPDAAVSGSDDVHMIAGADTRPVQTQVPGLHEAMTGPERFELRTQEVFGVVVFQPLEGALYGIGAMIASHQLHLLPPSG